MSDRAITAHAPLQPAEAQAALLAWVDDRIDPDDEGFIGAPTLVLEAQIHPLQEGVQMRWRIRHGEGPDDALLAAETDRALARCLANDGRWVVDGRVGPRP